MRRIAEPKALQCVGGPYHLQRILLECCKSGTLTITAKGMRGRYAHTVDPSYLGRGEYLKWETA